jgi:hypothetical protein|tara:strand:- start:2133 stop:2312 length:180 start_codon:yes stop_codon:yes gene_type:complete
MHGLTVKEGRLINDRRPSESGIAQLCRIKNSIRNEKKINQVAEGMERAEYKKNYIGKIF